MVNIALTISSEVLATVQRTKVPFSEDVVFITQEERAHYISVISRSIKELNEINANLLAENGEVWMTEAQNHKSTVKKDHINFNNELNEHLVNESAYIADILGDNSLLWPSREKVTAC